MTSFSKERINQIAEEVKRRSKARKDFIVDRANMRVVEADGALNLSIPDPENPDFGQMFEFRRGSLTQLSGALDLPIKYLDRLVNNGHTDLLAENLNTLLTRECTRTVRTQKVRHRQRIRVLEINGIERVDAVLSDSYRCLDNYDLFAIVLQQFKAMEAEGFPSPQIWDLRLTDDEFRMTAVASHISGQVSLDRTFDPGDGWMSRWHGEDGDVLNAAITISNSETGRGGLNARPSILRKVCANFCVWSDGVAQVHLGKRADEEGQVFISEETKKQEDRVVWLKIRDTIKNTFDPEQFKIRLDQINQTTKVTVPSATEAVSAAIQTFGLPEEHKEAILEEFLTMGDKSQYGLVQAITAQVNPKARETAELTEEKLNLFEDVGGRILGMSKKEFESFVTAV